jgi:hypothetical protein
MKIQIDIPDELLLEVQKFTGRSDINENLIEALSDWIYFKQIKKLNDSIRKNPLQFSEGFNSEIVRKSRTWL